MRVFFKRSLVVGIIVSSSLVGLFSSAHAQSTQITSGISYLSANQNQDGSWSGVSTTDFHSTSEVLSSLSVIGSKDTAYTNGLNWLNAQSVNTTEYFARRAAILGGAYFSIDLSTMLSYQNTDSGWGGYLEYASNNMDAASALFALKSANYPDSTVINNALTYLISNQNSDGGFGFYSGDGSNVYMTALVSYTLQQFPQTISIATAVNKATSYLIAHQNADGGFGSSPSTVYETAHAYIALVAVSTDATVLGNAINYLTSTQSADGSWLQDPYSTALALRALYFSQNKPAPPPPAPTTGTVTGMVVDASTNQPLSGVTVALVSNPSITAATDSTGNFSLSGIPAGSQQISFSLTGYTTSTVTVNVAAGSIINIGTIGLSVNPTTGIIQGIVTDASNGQPLSGAAITVTGQATWTAVTSTDGSYKITDITPGSVTVSASYAGYYTVSGTGTVTAGSTLIFSPSLSTTPPTATTGDLKGTVIDGSTGQPIQGASISIAGTSHTGTTTLSGAFSVTAISPNSYTVAITANGYTGQSYSVSIIAGVVTDLGIVNLNPQPAVTTITGKVRDTSTGSPIAYTDVSIQGSGLSTKTSSDGTYRLSGITQLDFTVRASAPGYDSLTYNVSTTAYGTYTVDFALNQSQTSNLTITSLATNNISYPANTSAIITATIENTGQTSTDALIVAQIKDNFGNVINLASPSNPKITIAPLSVATVSLIWNTGQFAPGDYQIILKATDPTTVGYGNPLGNVFAELASVINITPTASITGAISLNPPVTQAGAVTPVAIHASIRNTGNIPVTTTMRLTATLQGHTTPVYTMDQPLSNLTVNNVVDLDFGSFTPAAGGNYTVTLAPIDNAIFGTISKTLYAGPHAKGTFTVTPQKALPGDVRVAGKIHLEGVGTQTSTTQDPLVPIIKEAMQRGVNYEQGQVMWWHNAYRCNGCHIQAQALVGLEYSRNKVTVDPNVSQTLFNAFKAWQAADGSISRGYPWGYYGTQTQLGLWALISWHDQTEAKPIITKAADYLLTGQNWDGSWSADHTAGWWQETVSSTAITMMGVAQAYVLSNDGKYIPPLTKATQYMVAPNRVASNNNMARAHQIMGLEAVLNILQDANLKSQAQGVIDSAVATLKINQRTDGGWGRDTWYGSDSMVTAQILYALLKAGVPGDDPQIRKAIQFLLNTQSPDGSWYSQNGILSTRLAATTWVIISLPIALERVGGIDVETHLKLPDNVTLNSSIPLPASQLGSDYTWKVLGVDETGKDIDLDMTLKGLSLGEARKVAREAYLTFENSFTKEIVRYDIEIPSVLGDSFVDMTLSLDKANYPANTDVTISTAITNGSPGAKDLQVTWTIEDNNGAVVANLPGASISLISGETRNLTTIWNAGSTISGGYKVHAILKEAITVSGEKIAPFFITPDKTLTSKVVTDMASYNPNEQVVITSTVQSQSPNYIFENLTARTTITNSAGTGLFADTKAIPVLTTGQITELKSYWNTATNPKGTYTVKLEVLEGAAILSASMVTFEILSSSDTGSGLTGKISAQPNPVYQGREETFTYTVTNSGNANLQDITLKILIVDPDSQAIKQTLSTVTNIPMAGTMAGNLSTSTISLTPKKYLVILQAIVGTNTLTLASTTFEVLPGLDIKKTIPDYGRILVWINDGCIKDSEESEVKSQEKEEDDDDKDEERKECIRQDIIEKAMNEIGVTYYIVKGKKDFERELRNNYYTDYLILGDHNPLEDHYGEELRERVFSGKGIITSPWIGEDEDEELFDIEVEGKLKGRDNPVEFTESAIFKTQAFISSGRAVKIDEYNPANVLAWITDKDGKNYPAVLNKEYGIGKTIFFAFALGLSAREESYAQFVEILRSSLNYVHRPIDTTAFHPYDLAPIRIELKSLGAEIDLKITERYPDEIKLTDQSTGQWITENPWTKEFHLAANERKAISLFALTPDAIGRYNLTTDISYLENSSWKPYQTLSTEIAVEKDAHTLINDILYKLDTLYPATNKEREEVEEAKREIEKIRDRAINTKEDLDKNIHDIIEAIEAVMEVTTVDTKDVRLDMDRLLGIYGEWWYLG